MADFGAPSFSLGLDLDLDEEEEEKATIDLVSIEEEEEEVRVSDPKLAPLKRLKRGPKLLLLHHDDDDDDDDEIEDISSPEDNHTTGDQSRSSCSGSKVISHGFVPLSTQCSSKSKTREASNASCLTSKEKSMSKIKFPKLTISPLRRFQLVDSDSDSESEDLFEDTKKADISRSSSSRNTNAGCKVGSEDLWKDYGGKNIPTPALDDFCEEYFRSVKDKSKEDEICIVSSNQSNSSPPAYKYFYHDDPRIKRLVRQRLPNFFPLESRQSEVPDDIDYMCQFNEKEATSRNKGKGKQVEGSWVNPKNVPKDAGKRRVRAVGTGSGSGGSWFTGEDGKKVYVSRNGKEWSGRMAYLQYKKENGTGFKKSRKKKGGVSKKKSKS